MLKSKISIALICSGLFLFFVILTFPYQNLRGYLFSQIYKNTGIWVNAEELYPSLLGWPGIGLKNVSATVPVGNGEIELSSKKLVFRVGLKGLFPPTQSVSLSMSGLKQGGDLYVRFVQSKAKTSISLTTKTLELAQISIPGFPEPIPGKVDMDADLKIDSSDLSKSLGNISLDAVKLKIPAQNFQGIIFPQIQIGSIEAKIAIKNGTADLQSFQLGGKDSDLQGTLSGDLRLGPTFQASHLNLTVKLKLTEAFRQNPQSATLVSLLEGYKTGTAGEYAMRWSAGIQEMANNPLSAIPQKLTP